MNDVLTQDQIHSLFINLNKLADFQRRFLIGVESNASLAPEQQRFGHLFLLSVCFFKCSVNRFTDVAKSHRSRKRVVRLKAKLQELERDCADVWIAPLA